jgi:glycosyltransferase involved in cell wall biosynthesis
MAGRGRTIAVSETLARQLSRDLWMPPSRIRMIANGVPHVPPASTTLREQLRLRPEDRLLVSVGNLYPVKGHCHLVDALAVLVPSHPTLHVAIAGRGEMEDALTARARDRGVADRLHLLGLRSDVPAVLAAADVFVLPSLSEGLPLALLEAMFAGRPIVASAVGEVSAALAHGAAGVLVPPGDAHALAAAVDGVLRDAERARELGRAAARRAAAEYDIGRMVGRYVDVYEEALGRRAAATGDAAVEPA